MYSILYFIIVCFILNYVVIFQFKKQKKQTGSLTESQLEFLDSLLKVIVIKMKYDDETDWGGTEEEEVEEAEFLEMRKVNILSIQLYKNMLAFF